MSLSLSIFTDTTLSWAEEDLLGEPGRPQESSSMKSGRGKTKKRKQAAERIEQTAADTQCVHTERREMTDMLAGCFTAAPGHRTARRSAKALMGSRRNNDHTVELLIFV